jgi:hypothetical protein
MLFEDSWSRLQNSIQSQVLFMFPIIFPFYANEKKNYKEMFEQNILQQMECMV